MPRRKDTDSEPETREPAQRPPAYPLDEAMEEAYAPPPGANLPPSALPRHSDDWLTDSEAETAAAAAGPSGSTATASGSRDSNGHRQPASGYQQPASELASVMAGPSDTSSFALARATVAEAVTAAEPPESVAERLATLPQWQARYVLALMELGGIEGLAATRCNVSARSVAKAQSESPDFAAACREAVHHSTDMIEAASFRGATIGDTTPIYQGGFLVGYKRVRNTKDTEIMLKLRGRLKEESEVKHTGTVELIQKTEVPALLAEVTARLFAARGGQTRPVIDV